MKSEEVETGMEKLGEAALERLDALAAEMGVASEHMWEVLARQGVVEGWHGIMWTLLSSIALLVCAILYIRVGKWKTKNSDDEGFQFVALVATFVGMCASVAGVVKASSNAFYLLNPEMYALEYVRQLLGG